jgi:hypothetical protein
MVFRTAVKTAHALFRFFLLGFMNWPAAASSEQTGSLARPVAVAAARFMRAQLFARIGHSEKIEITVKTLKESLRVVNV